MAIVHQLKISKVLLTAITYKINGFKTSTKLSNEKQLNVYISALRVTVR